MKLFLSASMIITVLVAYAFNNNARVSPSQSLTRSVGITAYHVARQREAIEAARDAR